MLEKRDANIEIQEKDEKQDISKRRKEAEGKDENRKKI